MVFRSRFRHRRCGRRAEASQPSRTSARDVAARNLHEPSGKRVVGFDNAHGVTGTGRRFGKRVEARDHWHRTADDPGRPYRFTDAETLIDDFFAEVERTLRERGIGTTAISVEENDS